MDVDIKGTPWLPSVESLVRSEADFRFRCATSSGRMSVGSLVHSEADSHFRLLASDNESVAKRLTVRQRGPDVGDEVFRVPAMIFSLRQ